MLSTANVVQNPRRTVSRMRVMTNALEEVFGSGIC